MGLSKEEAAKLMDEIRENRRKLDSCDRHLFDPETYKLGCRMRCLKCDGTISSTDVPTYIAGYRAAGGDPGDIWPGWTKPVKAATQ